MFLVASSPWRLSNSQNLSHVTDKGAPWQSRKPPEERKKCLSSRRSRSCASVGQSRLSTRSSFCCILARMGSLDPPRSCFAFLIGALAFLAEQPGAAAETQATNCKFESLSEQASASGRPKQILDGRSFLLEDGREVRLAGIEVPRLSVSAGDSAGQPAVNSGRTALERLLASAQLSLKRLGSESDRYGRLLAQVFVEGHGG